MSFCPEHITQESFLDTYSQGEGIGPKGSPKAQRRPLRGVTRKNPPAKPIPRVYTDTRQPTPVGLAFASTGNAPWPLYQGLGKEGFEPDSEDSGVIDRQHQCWYGELRLSRWLAVSDTEPTQLTWWECVGKIPDGGGNKAR